MKFFVLFFICFWKPKSHYFVDQKCPNFGKILPTNRYNKIIATIFTCAKQLTVRTGMGYGGNEGWRETRYLSTRTSVVHVQLGATTRLSLRIYMHVCSSYVLSKPQQCSKKNVSDSPGQVDFVVHLVNLLGALAGKWFSLHYKH